ncbi:putative Glycosyl transferase family 2 [Methylacidimicrobium sp. AP8]|uniref:glycosyltransferase family 2 protein n=1 Tax=Methylacidimicrobium sp. AP8 TaxID=2730359 RepID=UPI0018BFE218|nr:glycosyltransferase family 2 protein [Methylacidimicrobium sp. AP8]CAB4242811.1 putative Glycosyl transferase family 2 [Methylacidimicrobium sp. AP8]
MTAPLVTIGIPAYNREEWIAQAVESALAQSWPHKEVLVADDGSTDRTREVLAGFGDRITVISLPGNSGPSGARNAILAAARGEWIQWLDSDDYLLPEKIETQLREGRGEPADVLVSPSLIEQWGRDGPAPPWTARLPDHPDPFYLWLAFWFPQIGAQLWRREALIRIGGWSPLHLAEDYELYARALQKGLRFRFTPSAGAVYRMGRSSSLTSSKLREFLDAHNRATEAMLAWLVNQGRLTPKLAEAAGIGFFQRLGAYKQFDPAEADRQLARYGEWIWPVLPSRDRRLLRLGLSYAQAARIKRLGKPWMARLEGFFRSLRRKPAPPAPSAEAQETGDGKLAFQTRGKAACSTR